MKEVKTIIDKEFIKIESPYNRAFITKARQIQGKWNSPYWVFPLRNKEYVINALIDIYGDCGNLSDVEIPRVEVTLDLNKYPYDCCIKIDTLVIAERKSRDENVILSSDVIVMQGGFEESGGSAKYPNIKPLNGTVLRVNNVPKTVAERVKNLEGITIKEINDITSNIDDKETLLKEKERLLKRLKEIDSLLNEN